MKKTSVLFLLFFILCHSITFSQTLTLTELLSLSNIMTATYDSRPAEINGIIDSYILKGFILDEFKRYRTNSTNTSSTEAYFKNNNVANNEQMTVKTEIIPPQGAMGERRICTIQFFTSDFPIFQSWFRELSTGTSYTLQIHGHVFHRYQYGFKTIEVGEVANHPTPPAGQTITEHWKFDASTVQRFYVTIQYPVSL